MSAVDHWRKTSLSTSLPWRRFPGRDACGSAQVLPDGRTAAYFLRGRCKDPQAAFKKTEL
ncbi:hypothetical protein C6Y45_16720 [Alkalicoccus saliphilus]|uniref:Uncharacterized protein n=1 Tax=Alkalicoccus saliphilus TaxID=200989 RepID=A0A2T4U1W8_9BACI|nr:hypothetical protein C6Y45_16720 [Alkalicoccus saliphilus]